MVKVFMTLLYFYPEFPFLINTLLNFALHLYTGLEFFSQCCFFLFQYVSGQSFWIFYSLMNFSKKNFLSVVADTGVALVFFLLLVFFMSAFTFNNDYTIAFLSLPKREGNQQIFISQEMFLIFLCKQFLNLKRQL